MLTEISVESEFAETVMYQLIHQLGLSLPPLRVVVEKICHLKGSNLTLRGNESALLLVVLCCVDKMLDVGKRRQYTSHQTNG